MLLHDHEYHSLTVADVVDETADTRSFVLEIPADLEEAFAYAAGQFCTFRATIDGESIVRCYSMSSSPDTRDRFTTTVKRVPGGLMSNWMNDTLAPGDAIEVLRPSGLFVLHDTEAPLVGFAGGSGITPVISIVKSALATTDRRIRLVYANRSADSVIFAEELEQLCSTSGGRLSIHHHLDAERGFLDAAQCASLVGDDAGADFYLCGPGPYMDTVAAGLSELGVAPDKLFIERFVLPDPAPVVEAVAVTESVVIRLEHRETTLAYKAGDTVLEAARRGGLSPPFSCEQGNCATCMAHLEEGAVTMRVNNALSPDELDDGWVLTCQALPNGPKVVVDYDA
ncbi:MAG TPA: ferredoxin--NADP reductase [Acidimicrobiia bacterium]|nr:ferredoxin--NADP reductase [Acidimicrobiia bacterium]